MVNGRQYNCTDQTSPTQFIVPTEPWRHCHHHHRHEPPPAATVICKFSIVHPAAATHNRTSMQELVVDAEALSTKCHLRRRALARKGRSYHNHSCSMALPSLSSSSSSSLPSPPSSPPSSVIYLIVVFVLSSCSLLFLIWWPSRPPHLSWLSLSPCCCRRHRRPYYPPPPRDLFDCCVHVLIPRRVISP